MKFIKLIIFTSLIVPFTANAETALTQSDILGGWNVNWEANNPRGEGANTGSAMETNWSFKADGSMTSSSIDFDPNARVKTFAATLKYRVEEGKLIKQVAPGRSTEDSCVAVEMNGSDLLLKCRFRYYSLTKK
ncbi:MAG: hypothetical protein HN942_01645 [Methylococcales bacterium]|jgi:hypothetical protein|nr:hypothetical protein [Methylococcales bacterium]